MSPTAYRRSVSVGCCSSPRCRLHDTTWTESSSTPITKPSFEPSSAYQPGKRLSRVHEAGSRTGSIRVAVEKLDRKSTRLNSSHLVISYAVFCLKKKKKRVH